MKEFKYPVFINISGGRTSGYMAYLFRKDREVKFLFQNTGRERPETYEFLKAMSDNWGIDITWLEYNPNEPKGFKIVDYYTANRSSVPFEQLLIKRQAIPNKAWRFCTQEMKIRTARRYIRSLGIKKWNSLLGFRADEPKRYESLSKRKKGITIQEFGYAPLYDMGITALDVADFWKNNSFDLDLPLLPNGKTYGGNCMGCFWHSEYQNADLCRTHPKEVDWLIKQEEKFGHTFVKGKPWKALKETVKNTPSKTFDVEDFYCIEPGGSCGL